MSTRAIYTFANFEANNFKDKHIYVHHDGYPEGAARYFDDMVYFADLSEPSDPDLLAQFVYVIEENFKLNAVPQANRLDAGDLEWGVHFNLCQAPHHRCHGTQYKKRY